MTGAGSGVPLQKPSRGLEGGLKPSEGEGGKGFEGCLKGASPSEGFKGALRMLLIMKSRLGGLFTRLSIIEMDTFLLPFQRCCCPCLRARQIAQLVEYSGLVKPEQLQQLSQG